MTYETREVGYTIRRIQLDPKGSHLDVYFEIPVFHIPGEGYEKINAFFEELADTFFSAENSNMDNIWERAWESGWELYDRHTAQVTCWSDKLVSVTLSSIWMAGGVKTYQIDGYTFRTDTGELLTLEEVTGQSAEEIKEEIINTLAIILEERGSDPERSLAEAEKYDLKDFDYGLDEEGYVRIYFDSGELMRTTAESGLTIHPWLYAKWQWSTLEPVFE
ncbi:MAG: hypothetical protein J6C43_05960 [Oscillospiraceae bacterium]|nr:hypothetical protein [Oscillospiraceae bacterium]MBP3519969.1 hypothetical protein [Oscillospiraceae bacterium]